MAKAVYLAAAFDSPSKAARRFSSVFSAIAGIWNYLLDFAQGSEGGGEAAVTTATSRSKAVESGEVRAHTGKQSIWPVKCCAWTSSNTICLSTAFRKRGTTSWLICRRLR